MSPDESAIRLATPADLPTIARLELEIFGADGYSVAEIQRLAGDARTFVQVAAREAEPVAYSIVQLRALGEFLDHYGIEARAVLAALPRDEIVGYLKTIAVRPDAGFRRRGLATALHAARIGLLRAQGVGHAFALQMPDPGLAAFHARLGLARLPAAVAYRYANGGEPSLWHAPL
jgi:ribosomal protein S18 acetylase RimI-like enzyme